MDLQVYVVFYTFNKLSMISINIEMLLLYMDCKTYLISKKKLKNQLK